MDTSCIHQIRVWGHEVGYPSYDCTLSHFPYYLKDVRYSGPCFQLRYQFFWPKPANATPEDNENNDSNVSLIPEKPQNPQELRIMPSAATIRDLEAIGENVTIEGYFNEGFYPVKYIVYAGNPLAKTATPHSENCRILRAVNECFKKDGLDTRSVLAIPRAKSQFIEKNEPGWDMSREVTHICGDPAQTALRGPDNSEMEDWEICGCDECQSARPGV